MATVVKRKESEKGKAPEKALGDHERVLMVDLMAGAEHVEVVAFSGLKLMARGQRQVGRDRYEADATIEVPDGVGNDVGDLPQPLAIRYSGAANLEVFGRFVCTLMSQGEPLGSAHFRQIESVAWREAQ